MAIMITDECINCGACEPECPNTAIYEGGVEWNYAGGTALKEIQLEDGSSLDAKTPMDPVSNEFYYIVTNKCTECTGFHEEPANPSGGQLRHRHRQVQQLAHEQAVSAMPHLLGPCRAALN